MLLTLLLSAPLVTQGGVVPAPLPETDAAITAADLEAHVGALASDAFFGRGPGQRGEEMTVPYISGAMARAGLTPAGDDGGWIQRVPMAELTPTKTPTVQAMAGGAARDLIFGRDLMVWSPVTEGAAQASAAEVVFCGYGIVAPEYGWNDYEGVDVRGKTVVVMVNDPGYATKDTARFRGSAMTYYGRWTYKFEEAARQGAAACLIVHEEGAAGYGWTVVLQSWGRPQLQLADSAGDKKVPIQGWLTTEAARGLIAAGGGDFDALTAAAALPGAAPKLLNATFSATIENRVRRIESANVAGMVSGKDRPDEFVLVSAHWDHLGIREGAEDEDNIFNGAVDNASGSAALLELAEAFGRGAERPSRSILFLAVTAEEKGLLGSKHYAAHPLVPPAKTVAGLNIDGLNPLGPMEDIVVVGYGASELDGDLRVVAAAQGRRVVPESTPERGYYFRSDHFSFAKVGVPMLYTNKGTTSVQHGADWVTEQNDEYLKKRYHRVDDEVTGDWDFEGARDDARLFHALLTLWSNDPRWREWAPDSEFRAAQAASLKAVGAK